MNPEIRETEAKRAINNLLWEILPDTCTLSEAETIARGMLGFWYECVQRHKSKGPE